MDDLQALIGAPQTAVQREPLIPGTNDNLVVLSGTLAGLAKYRRAAPPRIPQPSPGTLGAIAIAATLMDMGAQAQGVINQIGPSSWQDEADWVEFDMDGNHFKGVLWMMPMVCGDQVRVVAEKIDEHLYFAYAVQREADAVVAIYPHALMGRKARSRFERRGTLALFVVAQTIMTVMLGVQSARRGESLIDALTMIGIFLVAGAVLMMVVYLLGKWRFRNSIEDGLAESIFKAFGWPDPQNFDLRKVSRWPYRERLKAKVELDSYFQLCYFRYAGP